MLNENNIPSIQKGEKSLFTLNSDDYVYGMSWEREKTERDYYSEMANAEEEGEARGFVEGFAQGFAETLSEGDPEAAERIENSLLSAMKASGLTNKQIMDMILKDDE